MSLGMFKSWVHQIFLNWLPVCIELWLSVVTSVFRYFSKNRYLHISFEISTVIQHILYFLDLASLADHFYIDFDG